MYANRKSVCNWCLYRKGEPIPVAVRSKASVYSRFITGIAGSNPAEDMDFLLLCVVELATSETGWSLVQSSPRVCVCVWSRDLNNKAIWARVGPLARLKK